MSETSQGPGWWQASDGRWYPPQSAQAPLPPPPVYAAQQPGPYYLPPGAGGGMSGCLKAFLIVLGVLFGLGLLATILFTVFARDAVNDFNQRQVEAQDDVTDVQCRRDARGFMVAELSVTNDTPGASSYTIAVTFVGRGGATLATASAAIPSLAAGDSTQVEADTSVRAPETFTCHVDNVFRVRDRFTPQTGD